MSAGDMYVEGPTGTAMAKICSHSSVLTVLWQPRGLKLEVNSTLRSVLPAFHSSTTAEWVSRERCQIRAQKP